MTRLTLAALLCLSPVGAYARHAPGDSLPCEAGFCQGEKIVRWYKASRETAFATVRGFARSSGQSVLKVWRSAGGEEWWPARAILGHASGRGTRYAVGDRVVIKRDEGLKGRYMPRRSAGSSSTPRCSSGSTAARAESSGTRRSSSRSRRGRRPG